MYVLIRGGLGNQMFQAAFAFGLKNRYGYDPIFVDLTGNARIERNWGLDAFGIYPKRIGDVKENFLGLLSKLSSKIAKNFDLTRYGILIESERAKQYDCLAVKPHLISGYWQKIEFLDLLSGNEKNIFSFSKLKSCNEAVLDHYDFPIVGIHVRCGDYICDKIAFDAHYVCTPNWYQNAWDTINRKVGPCVGLIFSDDIDWVKKNINFRGNIRYIESKSSEPPVFDMYRIAQCDHFIISNSTFSWWAAYLGRKFDSIIICPGSWFRGVSTKDLGLCPTDWVLLD